MDSFIKISSRGIQSIFSYLSMLLSSVQLLSVSDSDMDWWPVQGIFSGCKKMMMTGWMN